jgi:Protein kinase domain
LITLDQTIKLIDFGLATTEHYPTDFDCGSKPYMSLECHNPDYPHYDAFQADIWSLGIIFINLFWHRSPWSRPDNSCPAYKSFTQHPTDFLVERFDGMPRSVATFLSDRVFCSEKKGRVKIAEWKAWCRNLVKLLSDDTSNRPTTPKKTIGFLPLTISLSTIKKNSAKSKESALSARLRRSSFFSILPPSPISSPGKRGTESNDTYFSPRTDHQHSKSWSQELDFDAEDGEMDFSEPISFTDKNTPPASEDETKKEGQNDNDSGFGSDEPDGTAPQSFLSTSPTSPAPPPVTSNAQQPIKTVPKYVPPAKRRNHIPTLDIRGSSKRYSTSSTQTAQPSSVGGQGYHVGAHQRRPFAPPQPSWRHKNQQQQQRYEPWQKSNVSHPPTKSSNGIRNPTPSFLKTNDKIPLYPPNVPVYTPPHRTSNTLTSASVSLFNNRMPGMTTHKSLADSSSVVQDDKTAADDLEMSEMDVVFGETQVTASVERRNHLTKGAISDFGKLLRSIARDRSQ